jgi:hypothetical protein
LARPRSLANKNPGLLACLYAWMRIATESCTTNALARRSRPNGAPATVFIFCSTRFILVDAPSQDCRFLRRTRETQRRMTMLDRAALLGDHHLVFLVLRRSRRRRRHHHKLHVGRNAATSSSPESSSPSPPPLTQVGRHRPGHDGPFRLLLFIQQSAMAISTQASNTTTIPHFAEPIRSAVRQGRGRLPIIVAVPAADCMLCIICGGGTLDGGRGKASSLGRAGHSIARQDERTRRWSMEQSRSIPMTS